MVTQPPRVKEVAAKPPRVATPTGSPPNNINDDFANRYNIIENVPELKLIQSHPNKDDDDDEEEQVHPQISTQEEQADAPARNTRSQHRTLTQEVIYSCMDITSTPATPRQLASRKFPMKLLCEIAGAVLDGSTGELLEYRHLRINPRYRQVWGKSFGNEIGRLAQGMPNRVKGTDTMFFIDEKNIPRDRRGDVTYGRIVCDVREGKAEKNRTRLTVGGNRINYPGDVGTPTACLLTVKLLVNSVVSTAGAEFMILDIKNFYLNTPLARYEYLRLKLTNLPEDVIEEYGLKEKETKDGYVYVEIRKGMYGLPQAGLLAQELLEQRLGKQGYTQSKVTPGFWTHSWRPISFTLVVDDFGVKYVGKDHADHLVRVLKEHYEISEDWEGTKYIGLTFDWDYSKRQVHVSMPGYRDMALTRFKHQTPKRKQDQPYKHVIPNYGTKIQFALGPDGTALLDNDGKKIVQ